ncbi:helix-turn-helix domain-containing protein [Paraburkholderia sediminicola]|uniref:helix-turn-helix domain-containing protein n=1 Tax=Paraburkholderia sediminicola TaxID=458836 RepID=UPI0038BBFBBE
MDAWSKTLTLADAAALLRAHPETVRLKAKAGDLPGRKVGKRWIFSLVALQRYLAGEWIPRVVQGDQAKETQPCRSLNAVQVPTGITSCTRREADRSYMAALAPKTKPKRRNSMTG